MLGIEDPNIALVYVLCILSTLLCVVYGAMNWNKGDEPVFAEDKKWVADEKEVVEEL